MAIEFHGSWAILSRSLLSPAPSLGTVFVEFRLVEAYKADENVLGGKLSSSTANDAMRQFFEEEKRNNI